MYVTQEYPSYIGGYTPAQARRGLGAYVAPGRARGLGSSPLGFSLKPPAWLRAAAAQAITGAEKAVGKNVQVQQGPMTFNLDQLIAAAKGGGPAPKITVLNPGQQADTSLDTAKKAAMGTGIAAAALAAAFLLFRR